MLKVLFHIDIVIVMWKGTEQIRADISNTQKIIYYVFIVFCITSLCVSLGLYLVKAIAMIKNVENNKK